jgi:transposase-like protein
VRRLRCSACGRTFTLLLENMLPYKHYAAPEIEQVLLNQEEPNSLPHECGAEESTLHR